VGLNYQVLIWTAIVDSAHQVPTWTELHRPRAKLRGEVVPRSRVVNSSFKFRSFLHLTEVFYGNLKPSEIYNAKLLWIFHYQQAFFPEEIRSLRRTSKTEPKLPGAMLKLNPFLKEDLLRVGGRLDRSLLPMDQKHPYILPGDCFLSQLLINRAHLNTLHGGVQMTLATLRLEIWIMCGRRSVKKVIDKCKTCVRFSKQICHPIMGELPSARVTPSPPFNRSGVDYAGPFSIRLTKTRGRGP